MVKKMNYRHLLRIPRKHAAEVAALVEREKANICAAYDKELGGRGPALILGDVEAGTKEVAVEVASDDCSLNVLSDVLANVIPTSFGAKLPYFG